MKHISLRNYSQTRIGVATHGYNNAPSYIMLAAILGLTSEWRYAQDRARWQYLDLVETAVLHADDDGDTGKHL